MYIVDFWHIILYYLWTGIRVYRTAALTLSLIDLESTFEHDGGVYSERIHRRAILWQPRRRLRGPRALCEHDDGEQNAGHRSRTETSGDRICDL